MLRYHENMTINMTNPPNVLACPFCNHVGIDIVEGSTFRWRLPECGNCGATCGEVRHDTMADDQAQAEIETHHRCVEAWNTRANDGMRDLTDEELSSMVRYSYTSGFNTTERDKIIANSVREWIKGNGK